MHFHQKGCWQGRSREFDRHCRSPAQRHRLASLCAPCKGAHASRSGEPRTSSLGTWTVERLNARLRCAASQARRSGAHEQGAQRGQRRFWRKPGGNGRVGAARCCDARMETTPCVASPLQGASAQACADRSAGGQHAARIPCCTLARHPKWRVCTDPYL